MKRKQASKKTLRRSSSFRASSLDLTIKDLGLQLAALDKIVLAVEQYIALGHGSFSDGEEEEDAAPEE
jgi:hypothetical protein